MTSRNMAESARVSFYRGGGLDNRAVRLLGLATLAPNPFAPSFEKQRTHEHFDPAKIVYIPEGNYGIARGEGIIGTGGMSPCVSVGLYDPETHTAAIGHFNTRSDPQSLNAMFADMLPGVAPSAYGRLQAIVVGGMFGSPLSQQLAVELLSIVDSHGIQLRGADVLREGSKALTPNDFAIDAQTGEIITGIHGARRVGTILENNETQPLSVPLHKSYEVAIFEGRVEADVELSGGQRFKVLLTRAGGMDYVSQREMYGGLSSGEHSLWQTAVEFSEQAYDFDTTDSNEQVSRFPRRRQKSIRSSTQLSRMEGRALALHILVTDDEGKDHWQQIALVGVDGVAIPSVHANLDDPLVKLLIDEQAQALSSTGRAVIENVVELADTFGSRRTENRNEVSLGELAEKIRASWQKTKTRKRAA